MQKKTYYIFFALLSLTLIASVVVSFFISKIDYVDSKQSVPKEAVIYTVQELDGKIAVYEGESKSPTYVYSVLVSTLPPLDQQALKNGIKIDSMEKLVRLIEDYTS